MLIRKENPRSDCFVSRLSAKPFSLRFLPSLPVASFCQCDAGEAATWLFLLLALSGYQLGPLLSRFHHFVAIGSFVVFNFVGLCLF